jgi:chaperonin GroES
MAPPTCEGKSLFSADENVLYPIGDFRVNIRPLHDRIVVKPIETRDSTAGGLFIPDGAREKPQEGKVVAVSRGKRLEDGSQSPLDVALGDHILYGKYTGSEIKLAGEEYLIVREDEVLGVLEGAEEPATKVA